VVDQKSPRGSHPMCLVLCNFVMQKSFPFRTTPMCTIIAQDTLARGTHMHEFRIQCVLVAQLLCT
jgi:hypothetical protein